MEYELLMTIITDVGFPAFVAALLLLDKMRNSKMLREAIDNNTSAIRDLEDFLSQYGFKRLVRR